MTNLVQWRRPSMLSLKRDIEDVFGEMSVPRSIRREMERLFDDFDSPRSLWREMDRMLEDFDVAPTLGSRISRVFETFLGEPRHIGSRIGGGAFIPNLDLTEKDNEYVMKADLPGVREQDIDIRVSDDNVLTLSGERRAEETSKQGGYEYNERTYGAFSRSVELPAGTDPAKIQADFRNGVLELHVPKAEVSKGRRIPLTRGGEEPRVIATGNGGTGVQAQQGQGTQQQRNT